MLHNFFCELFLFQRIGTGSGDIKTLVQFPVNPILKFVPNSQNCVGGAHLRGRFRVLISRNLTLWYILAEILRYLRHFRYSEGFEAEKQSQAFSIPSLIVEHPPWKKSKERLCFNRTNPQPSIRLILKWFNSCAVFWTANKPYLSFFNLSTKYKHMIVQS